MYRLSHQPMSFIDHWKPYLPSVSRKNLTGPGLALIFYRFLVYVLTAKETNEHRATYVGHPSNETDA
jgi:hypothetical protein